MERIKKFDEIRRSLTELRKLGTTLRQDFSAWNEFLTEEKFVINNDLLENTPKTLQKFVDEEHFCHKLLMEIFKKYPTERFSMLEEFLDVEEKKIFEASVFGRAEKFLHLTSINPAYQKSLTQHQKKLRVMLEKKTYDAKAEEIATPYANFIDAMNKPTTGEKISKIQVLGKSFNNDFIGAGLFDGELIFQTEETLPEEFLKESPPEESEFIKILREENALLTEKDFEPWEKIFTIEKHERDKEFSAKRFKSDFDEPGLLNPLITLTITKGCIAFSSCAPKNFTREKFESAVCSLCKKGYFQKFNFENLGDFYGVTKKFFDFVRNDNGKKFLNSIMKGRKIFSGGANFYDDDVTRILPRAIYFRIHAQDKNPGKSFASVDFSAQSFRSDFYADNGSGLLIGCFWDSFDECDKFLKRLRQYLNEHEKIFYRIIIAGLTVEHAEKIFNALEKALLDDFPTYAEIYFYAADKDEFYLSGTKEIISASEIFATPLTDEKSLDDESFDERKSDNNLPGDEQLYEESIVEDKVEDDFDLLEEAVKEKILINLCEMISEKKFYCATAYLRVLSFDYDKIEPLYRRLAFALNDPIIDANYSSNEVSTLFAKNNSAFDKALITAAALRAFFYNHMEFDPAIPALYDKIRPFDIVSSNEDLARLIADLKDFKLKNNKGAEFFAKYHTEDEREIQEKFDKVVQDAKEYFQLFFEGDFRGETNRTVAKAKMSLFSSESTFCNIFKLIKSSGKNFSEDDLNAVKEFLAENFIRKGAAFDKANLDKEKLQDWIKRCWDEVKSSTDKGGVVGSRRSNLLSGLEHAGEIMCDWLSCVENMSDSIQKNYHEKIFNDMFENANKARKNIEKKIKGGTLDDAGQLVLCETLKEISEHLKGTFKPCEHEFFYINFLLGEYIALDEKTLLPNFEINISDGTNESLSEQIERHAKIADLPSVQERIKFIFEQGGDDFGSSRILDTYLKKSEGKSFIAEKNYDLEKIIYAAALDVKREHEEFTGGLVLAQIHGNLSGLPDDTKEKILFIVNNCYEYSKESSNYGVFLRVKKFWDDKIEQNAVEIKKSLGKDLEMAIEEYKKIVGDSNLLEMEKSCAEIEKLIESKTFTTAKKCIFDLRRGKLREQTDVDDDDTLSRFISYHDDYYKREQNINTSLKNLIKEGDKKNKFYDAKVALPENWLPNDMPDSEGDRENLRKRVENLLILLGFDVESIKTELCDENSISYEIKLKKSFQIRHNHPIAAFGSEGESDKLGFRVTCLFRQFPQENLLDYLKKIDNGNTLVLLDHALKLTVRRQLAKSIKHDKSLKHVFAILDRVVMMYLIIHCSEQIKTKKINDTLMAILMPFSRCQPYISESRVPLPPEMFIGRENEIKAVEDPNGVNIVYGGRQLGKSSLLKMACRQIDGDKNQRAIFVDLSNKDYIEAALLTSKELSDKNFFVEPFVTDSWEELARAIQNRLASDVPTKIRYLLLMLDEADKFIESCAGNYEPIVELSRIQKEDYNGSRFKFVITCLRNIAPYDKEQVQSDSNPTLKPLKIKPFSFAEAKKLLEVPLRYLGLRFTDDKFIYTIEETALYFPGLIQLFCEKLLLTLFDSSDYGENTPPYEISEKHIKKILADDFIEIIKEKINIALEFGGDKYYYVIAQLLAYLYHTQPQVDGYLPREILTFAKSHFKEIVKEHYLPNDESKIDALMTELCDLNILSKTDANKYLFSGQSIYRYMGTLQKIEDVILDLMSKAENDNDNLNSTTYSESSIDDSNSTTDSGSSIDDSNSTTDSGSSDDDSNSMTDSESVDKNSNSMAEIKNG